MKNLSGILLGLLLLLIGILIIVSYIGATGLFIYFFVNLFLNHFAWWQPLLWLGIDIVVIFVLLVVSLFFGTE